MSLVLAVVPPERLAEVEGLNATAATLLSYTSRHLSRVESLLQKTFLFDLVLQSSSQGLPIHDVSAIGERKAERSITSGGPPSAEDALKRTMEVLLGDDADHDLDDEDEEQGAETEIKVPSLSPRHLLHVVCVEKLKM
eukprot:5937072-Amphidinium_carterae.1